MPEFYSIVLPRVHAQAVALEAIRTDRRVTVTPYPDDLFSVEVRAPENREWLDKTAAALSPFFRPALDD